MTEEQKIKMKDCYGIMPEAVVGVYILNKHGKFLLMRSKKWEKLASVGGHIEFGEKIEDAVVREAKEETGLDIYDLQFLRVVEAIKPKDFGEDRHLIGLHYLAKTDAEEKDVKIEEREHDGYVWLTPEEILKSDETNERSKKNMEIYLEKYKNKKSGLFNRECKKCEEAKKDCEEYKVGWQRALADYKNLQAETAKRRGEWAQMSEVQILEEFIPVYDHLKMSIAGVDKSDAWVEGVKHVLRQFADILKAHGVEEIKTVGEKFDPAVHEAAGEEVVEDTEPGVIIKEIMPGYKMGERVIRAARVIVSK